MSLTALSHFPDSPKTRRIASKAEGRDGSITHAPRPCAAHHSTCTLQGCPNFQKQHCNLKVTTTWMQCFLSTTSSAENDVTPTTLPSSSVLDGSCCFSSKFGNMDTSASSQPHGRRSTLPRPYSQSLNLFCLLPPVRIVHISEFRGKSTWRLVVVTFI